MKVSILGCGWFGGPLAKELLKKSYQVCGSTQHQEKKILFEKEGVPLEIFSHPNLPSENLLDSDWIILNIPPREEHLSWFKKWAWNFKSKIIFISSTSSREILIEQENWIKNYFPHWLILRFGGLVGPQRNPGKFLAGKKNLTGRLWPVNLIHLDDVIGFTLRVIELNLLHETINVVSDEDHSREEFYQKAAQILNLELPEFDQSDLSTKEKISNERMKSIYDLQWPRIFGKSL